MVIVQLWRGYNYVGIGYRTGILVVIVLVLSGWCSGCNCVVVKMLCSCLLISWAGGGGDAN